MPVFAVWGEGAAQSDLVRNAEIDILAVIRAEKNGYTVSETTSRWAVLLECDEEELDAATRFDSAVVGYQEVDPFYLGAPSA